MKDTEKIGTWCITESTFTSRRDCLAGTIALKGISKRDWELISRLLYELWDDHIYINEDYCTDIAKPRLERILKELSWI